MVENTDSGDTGLLVTLGDSGATTREGRRGGLLISPLLTYFKSSILNQNHCYIESQATGSASPLSYTALLTGMDQTGHKPAQDSTPAYTLTVGQLRELVREEVQAARTSQQDADRLLNADEAANLLSVSEDWLYRHAKKLPFTRKLGPKMVRFSYQGIIKWLATRTGN